MLILFPLICVYSWSLQKFLKKMILQTNFKERQLKKIRFYDPLSLSSYLNQNFLEISRFAQRLHRALESIFSKEKIFCIFLCISKYWMRGLNRKLCCRTILSINPQTRVACKKITACAKSTRVWFICIFQNASVDTSHEWMNTKFALGT